MSNPLTAATKKVVNGRGRGTQPDLNEDLKETVKQAIYEVREEQQGGSKSKSNGAGGQAGKLALIGLGIAIGRRLSKMGSSSGRKQGTKIDVQSGDSSTSTRQSSGSDSSSGSSLLRTLMFAVGVGAIGFAAYRRRKSKQSTTHIDHTGDVKHTDESELPQAETQSSDAEPPSTEERSGEVGGGVRQKGVDEDVVAPEPESGTDETSGSEDETE